MSSHRAWPRIASEPATGEAYLAIARPDQPVERIQLSPNALLKIALEAVIAAIEISSRRPPPASAFDEGPGPEIGLRGE